MVDAAKKEQKTDDNSESSSTGSDRDKAGTRRGNGSGGGYSVDYSSSDGSSLQLDLEAVKGNVPEKQMTRLSVRVHVRLSGGGNKEKATNTKEAKPTKSSKSATHKPQKAGTSGRPSCDTSPIDQRETSHSIQDSDTKWENAEVASKSTFALPQWSGVRIPHPMDPRIDLSTVGHIQTSSISAFPSNVDVDIPAHQRQPSEQVTPEGENENESAEPPPPPSIDQYMKLMEVNQFYHKKNGCLAFYNLSHTLFQVVRPFFHAHGITQGFSHPRSDDNDDETSNERPCSDFDFVSEPSDSDQKRSVHERKLEVPVAAWNTSKPAVASSSHAHGDPHESHSSSKVVLARARARRNHFRKSAEDPTDDASDTSSSSEKCVTIQQPQHVEAQVLQKEEAPTNKDDKHDINVEAEQATHQADVADRQESASASSSEDRNKQDAPPVAPMRYGVPAVVSEYSSSARTGSSGASNNNLTSTSGSGSGGNTGSGTGSGSNQGGSSGSGNDQGGISSNGNGSSGSGNEVKGSGEETLDNSGENSGGNSDATNSKNEMGKNAASVAADAPYVSSSHRHSANPIETPHKDSSVPALPHPSHGEGGQIATREKKLQDKKRKRMNMRREYEEKVQQEMESSEGSQDRGDFSLKPGRPVTLDKVLSFTKIARCVT